MVSIQVTCAKLSAMAAQGQSWCRGSNSALANPAGGKRARMPIRRLIRALVKVDAVAGWLATSDVSFWQILLRKSPVRSAKGLCERWCRPFVAARSSRSGGCDALILTPATPLRRYPTLTQHTQGSLAAVGP